MEIDADVSLLRAVRNIGPVDSGACFLAEWVRDAL